MVIMAAADEAELVHMTATAAAYDEGPIAFRYPRGEGTGVALPATPEIFEIGKGRILREGDDVAILSLGTRLADALRAADLLEQQGIRCTVADARFAKPLDERLVERLARNHAALVTVEEGAIAGFGAQVSHLLSSKDLLRASLAVRHMTLPDRFQDHGDMAQQYAEAGLDASAIAKLAGSLVGKPVLRELTRASKPLASVRGNRRS
jgi:1-deoxy-D-xylulose-5-phosphate synthase